MSLTAQAAGRLRPIVKMAEKFERDASAPPARQVAKRTFYLAQARSRLLLDA